MNLLRLLGLGKPSDEDDDRRMRQQLPLVNSFVEIALAGSRGRISVPISDITRETLVTRPVAGITPGIAADFLYTNDIGKFRFATVCSAVDTDATIFALPTTIKTIQSFGDRRSASRVPWLIPVQWRYAPDGVGYGPFLDASMMDLSRGGASLVVGRELKAGSQVEVRFSLKSKEEPFIELCQVVRAAKIETSDKNAAGIRFVEIDRENERILSEFVNERQALRRDRGVV
jgi:hypothetical protein